MFRHADCFNSVHTRTENRMADIQSVLSTKFMQVASAAKSNPKDVADAGSPMASFLGVLNAQLSNTVAPGAALPLPVDGLKLPVSAQPDAENAAPAASDEDLAAAPLPVDPSLAAAAMASVVSANAPLVKDFSVSPPEAGADAILSRPLGDAGVKTGAAAKPVNGQKPDASAINADARQALPLATPAAQTEAAPIAAEAKAESKVATVAASVLPALASTHGEAPAPTPITLAHPFEQVLRQAESRVNAAIDTPVQSASFASELADKVVWLSGRQGQIADISLNPPQMGPLEVRLTVSGGDATAQFFSPNPAVRDAIDAALPKLREMMAQAGLSLGNTGVHDQTSSQREAAQQSSQATASGNDIVVNQATLASIGMIRSSGAGLVDLYI
jgi:flagellar hook-length control protein FliK